MNPELNRPTPDGAIDCPVAFSCRQLEDVDARDWNRLFQASAGTNLFYDFAFVHAAVRAWPNAQALKVIVGYKGNSLVFLQVCRIDDSMLGRTIELYAPPTADHIEPLINQNDRPGIVRAFGDYLVEALRPDLLIAASVTGDFGAEIRSRLHNCTIKRGSRQRGWFLDIPESVEAFWARYRSNFRSQLRRQLRKADAHGIGLRFVTEEGLPPNYTIPKAMDNLKRLHRLRFEALNRRSFFLKADFQRFHQYLSREASAGSCTTCFTEAIHEGKVVGSIYGMRAPGTYLFLMTGFDPRFAEFSPGALLLYHTVENLIRHGVRRFDFKCGDESYKRRWASGWYEKADLEIILTPRGRLLRASLRTEGHARRISSRLSKHRDNLVERVAI